MPRDKNGFEALICLFHFQTRELNISKGLPRHNAHTKTQPQHSLLPHSFIPSFFPRSFPLTFHSSSQTRLYFYRKHKNTEIQIPMAKSVSPDAISTLLANPSPDSSSDLPDIVVQVLDLKQSGNRYMYVSLYIHLSN